MTPLPGGVYSSRSTRTMAGSGGVATRRAYRNTGGYLANVAGRVGDLDPDRLYSYRFVVC